MCGISRLKPSGLKARDAYDHYLAKSLYPFNPINTYNLVPTCHECNSDFKGADDILLKADGTRSAAFYPYSTETYNLVLRYEIRHRSNKALFIHNKDWKPKILCNENDDERVRAWTKTYGIEHRYHEYTNDSELVWLKAIVKNYKIAKRRLTPFDQFKQDYMDQYDSILSGPMDILEKAYAEYILSLDEIQETLDSFLDNGVPE